MKSLAKTATGGYLIPAGARVEGQIHPPPSKSLTQRALNLALLARCPIRIWRPLLAQDTELFLAALHLLGIRCSRNPEWIDLYPDDPTDTAKIWCGNNGTMLRFLIGALPTVPGRWSLDGSPRLRQRPVGPLVDALRLLGAVITYRGEEGFAPLDLEGGTLKAGEVQLDAGLSSQFVSALIMAATRAEGQVSIRVVDLVSQPYLNLTLEVLAAFGAELEEDEGARSYRIAPSPLWRDEYTVEADFSSAAYPAAAALITGGRVLIEGVKPDSRQGDRRFLDVLARMGGRATWLSSGVEFRAGGQLQGVDIDLAEMPDQVPTLAALAPFAAGRTRIRNVRHLRLKESDRLSAMVAEMGRLGAIVTEREDGLEIEGSWVDRSEVPSDPVHVDTHGDHRVAMSLAICGLARPGVIVDSPEVVVKSFPSFWEKLDSLLEA